MTVSRPAGLTVGEQVRFGGSLWTVMSVAGRSVELIDVAGARTVALIAELFADVDFAVVSPSARRVPLPSSARLEGLPQETIAKARWWERHLAEVVSGLPPDSAPDAVPRPGFEPGGTTLRQREIAKCQELAAAGQLIPLSTLQRQRHRYESAGLWGLVDSRLSPQRVSAADPRLLAALRTAVDGERNRSTGTVGRLRRRVEQILAAEGVDPVEVMPARATFYRLVARVAAGRHTFGSAPTRRSLAQQPDGPFGAVTVLRPGEWTQIDSTPLDVRVVLDDGTVGPGRVDLVDRHCHAHDRRSGAAAVDEGGGRLAAAGPGADAGADAAGMAGRAADVPVGDAACEARQDRRAVGPGRGPSGDRARDDRVRPRQGVPVADVSDRVSGDGHQFSGDASRIPMGERDCRA